MTEQYKGVTKFVAIAPGYRAVWTDSEDPSGYYMEEIAALACDPNEEVVAISLDPIHGFKRVDSEDGKPDGYLAPGQTLNIFRACRRAYIELQRRLSHGE